MGVKGCHGALVMICESTFGIASICSHILILESLSCFHNLKLSWGIFKNKLFTSIVKSTIAFCSSGMFILFNVVVAMSIVVWTCTLIVQFLLLAIYNLSLATFTPCKGFVGELGDVNTSTNSSSFASTSNVGETFDLYFKGVIFMIFMHMLAQHKMSFKTNQQCMKVKF